MIYSLNEGVSEEDVILFSETDSFSIEEGLKKQSTTLFCSVSRHDPRRMHNISKQGNGNQNLISGS
jgi:hypothetical protein